ncbi:MAG: hypothetical protein H3C58_01590 [Fimbriimonadaceae bacterium]|nr:hypothetical protein [Fimbriimonadaceae bacterium]
MAIQIGPLTRPNGLTVSDNPGFLDPTWNWAPMAYASNYAPFYWNSRNYDPFPNAVWTAAHAKLGIEAWALQGLDFAQRHYAPTHQLFIETQRPLMLNHHMMWYIAAKRWLADSTWRMV